MPRRCDVRGKHIVIQTTQIAYTSGRATPAALAQLLPFFKAGTVARDKSLAATPSLIDVTSNERLLDKHVASSDLVDCRQCDATSLDDCKPVERDALWNHRSTRCGVPLGFPVRASDRVARDRLNPFRLNRRHSPSPKAIGFNDFSGDYPFATRPTDCRPGNNLKSSSPSTLIFDSCPPIALRPAFVSTTDVRQQTRQHSLMHPIGVARISARSNADLSGDLPKLTVEIAPFAHSQPVEILITTHPPECVARQCFLLLFHVIPERNNAHEIRPRNGKAAM